jgi:tetratricopeptide (TPR) repeat protein
MKKIKLLYVLSGFCLLLILSGCSNNPAIKDRYQVEKSLHFAEKEFEQQRQISGNFTNNQLAHFENVYKDLYEKAFDAMTATDSITSSVEYNELVYLTYRIGVRLNQLTYSQNKYSESSKLLSGMITDIPMDESLKSSMYFNLGQLQLSIGNTDSALNIYEYCIDKFYPPLDQSNEIDYPVFNLPMFVVNITKIMNNNQSNTEAFVNAENYYNRLINDFPDSKLSLSSHTNLAKLYEDNQNYEKELEQLKIVTGYKKELEQVEIETDPDSPGYFTLKMKTAQVLSDKLKRYDEALQIYNESLNEAKPEDSLRIAQLHYFIAEVKMDQGEYTQVRAQLTKVENYYPIFYASSPEIQYVLAKSYELENNWDLAKPEYSLLIEKFKDSEQAINSLIYLNGHFKEIGRIAEADQWYKQGIEHLNNLITNAQGTYTEARANLGLANLYYNNEEWQKSVDILTGMFRAYPTTQPGRMAGMRALNIYRDKLNNSEMADSLMEEIKASLSSLKNSDQPLNLLE